MEGTRRFGLAVVRFQQTVFVVVGLAQLLSAVRAWRDAGGPDGWVLLSGALIAGCVLAAVAVQRQIVRVGDGRIAWRLGYQHHDLPFDQVADIRRDPRWWAAASQVVTTDGRVLRLPLQPRHGPEVWHLVLGERNPAAP
jgi:hypothetical protein